MLDAPRFRSIADRAGRTAPLHLENDLLRTVKRSLIHSGKSRFRIALAKGLDIAGANEPQDVHKDKPPEDWHVPLDQMIYVGDGGSDIDAFNLLHSAAASTSR